MIIYYILKLNCVNTYKAQLELCFYRVKLVDSGGARGNVITYQKHVRAR